MSIKAIDENTPEWHEIRKRHVGGSEIAALFGLQSEYQMSEFTLHAVKSGRIPALDIEDGPGSRIWFGRRLEAPIAHMLADIHGWKISKGGYAVDDQTEGMGCSVDYMIDEPGDEEVALGFSGPGVLQIKNVDWLVHRRSWVAQEPPPSVLLQLQHEIACTGMQWGAVGCMIGGNETAVYRYARRPRLAETIRERVRRFWDDVRNGTWPTIDPSNSTSDAIRELFPTRETPHPIDMTGHPDFEAICQQYAIAAGNRRASEAAVRMARSELEAILQGATAAVSDGWAVNVAVIEETATRRGSRRISVTERTGK